MQMAFLPAGSGKTLAYLLPLVQRMREEEQSICNSLTVRNSPRIVVLVPTNELCAQACPLLRNIHHGMTLWHVYRSSSELGHTAPAAMPGS